MKNITGFYRNWRIKNRITIDRIAMVIGVSRTAIQKFEVGTIKSQKIQSAYDELIKYYPEPVFVTNETSFRRWRCDNGYTLCEIADYIGCSHQAVWLFEKGALNSERLNRGYNEFIEAHIERGVKND